MRDDARYQGTPSLHGPDARVLSSDLSKNVLRRAPDRDLIGRCSVLGVVPRRALVRTDIASEGDYASLVCFVTAYYALPRS